MLKIIFSKYGDIKDLALLPGKNKAVIEFVYRLSAVLFKKYINLLTQIFRKKLMKSLKKNLKKKWEYLIPSELN